MTDELETLRSMRDRVEPPSSAARRAAQARWDAEPLDLVTTVVIDPRRAAKSFTMRALIAGVVAVAVVAGAWMVTRARVNSVKPQHVVAVTPLAGASATEPQVFLLVGSDSRAFVSDPAGAQQFGAADAISGARTDTIILVRIDPSTRHVLAVSIPRDLFVDIPGCGRQKINAAFNDQLTCDGNHGGVQLLVRTITSVLGVPINHVIEVQFPQYAALVDALGGLRIQFPEPARDAYSGLLEPAGCVTLDGSQALAFVRSRHLQWFDQTWREDPRADLGRMDRQQLALRQLAAAAESHLSTDPRPLLRALFANVTVDSGFTASDALRYFDALRGNHPTVTMTLPTDPSGPAGLVLAAGAQPVLAALNGHEGGGVANTPVAPRPAADPVVAPTSC
jgi:LCP family protein required for cell wall assembly